AALFLGDWEVLEGGHPVALPVAPFVGDRLEVARASKLLRAEAFGHLACELRDVTLLGCLDENSLHAERLQLGRSRLAAFRIPLDPRHVATLCCLTPAADGSSDMAKVRSDRTIAPSAPATISRSACAAC